MESNKNNYGEGIEFDKRTQQLLRIFVKNWDDENDDSKFDNESILNTELIEYDCLRLFKYFTQVNSSKDIDTSKARDKLRVTEIGDRELATHQKETLKNCKIFSLSKPIKHLLQLTKPCEIKEEIKLPFNSMFIDTDIFDDKNNLRIFGILIEFFDRKIFQDLNNKIKSDLNLKEQMKYDLAFSIETLTEVPIIAVSTLFYAEEKGMFHIVDFNFDLSSGKIIKKKLKIIGINRDKYQTIIEKVVSVLITNLLLFLNEPRVIIYIKESNNERRAKKGLIPIPSQLKTKIEVGLENYIEKIYFNGLSHSKLGFSFWVRGHWRRFLSPRFVNKRGQKTWILPHISGEGLMPPQVFEVTHSKDKQIKQEDKGETTQLV
ncbi:MAG: hypothetical protein EHM47_00855 [Ignavibacteriales bacterium]|nr:MAG: hypothetical protein EHM47_00855 [Ignavibacteriales bacterium]